MIDKQTFADGFIQGWQSVIGQQFPLPEIPSPSTLGSRSAYIYGLMDGIEAAKKLMAEMINAKASSP